MYGLVRQCLLGIGDRVVRVHAIHFHFNDDTRYPGAVILKLENCQIRLVCVYFRIPIILIV